VTELSGLRRLGDSTTSNQVAVTRLAGRRLRAQPRPALRPLQLSQRLVHPLFHPNPIPCIDSVVRNSRDEAHQRANLLVDLREEYQQRYQSERSENILELVMGLFEEPYLDVNTAAGRLDVEYSTANRLIGQLEDDGILEELTGKERNRFYRASKVFKIINKPIDQL
jgi:ribosomal protein S25